MVAISRDRRVVWLAGWRACHRLELFSGTGNSRTENFLRFRFGKLAIFAWLAWLLLVVVGDKNSSEKLLGRAQKSAPTSFIALSVIRYLDNVP